jgi:hypothetical protein
MKTSSPLLLLCLLASVAIAVCFVGCSRSENKPEKESFPGFRQTPEDEAFAKAYGAAWITTNLLSTPVQLTLTVDFQDGLFTEGSTLACDLWVSDVQRENGVLLLTGTSFSIPGDFEIEITTNMLSSIRAAGDRLSFVRLAFRVESFQRIENKSSEDSSDRYVEKTMPRKVTLWLLCKHRFGQERKRRQKHQNAEVQSSYVVKTIDLFG